MAFLDENGRITIGEDAANADVSKIHQAQENLARSRTTLKALVDNAGTCSGETALAISEKGTELLEQLNRLDQNLTDTAEYILRVVEIYRQKDLALKAMIESSE